MVYLYATAQTVSPTKVTKWCLKRDGLLVTQNSSFHDTTYYDLYYANFDSPTGCWNSTYGITSGAVQFDTTAWPDGTHTYTLVVTDSSNRSSTAASISITNTNGGPQVDWAEPANGSTLNGLITLKATAAPDPTGTSKVTKWCLKRDGLLVTQNSSFHDTTYYDLYYANFDSPTGCWNSTYGITSGAVQFDTAGWSNAAHNLEISVTDSSGRSASATLLINTWNRKAPSQISAGGNHTCARTVDATVRCWGLNSNGQVGDGTYTSRTTPAVVPNLTSVSAVSAGGAFTCVVISAGANGKAKCWGSNSNGQLGNGTLSRSLQPVFVMATPTTALTGVNRISAGTYFACAVVNPGSTGTARCWGANNYGQLGNGNITQQTRAVTVRANATSTMFGATQVAAGANSACAILTSGAVRCWGANNYGQLGNGTTVASRYPVKVSGIDGVSARATSVSVGNGFACARLTNGNVRCWGRNDYGQLGNGVAGNRSTPVTVMYSATEKLPYLTMVTAGGAHACAILAVPGYDTDIYCWGRNADGQLGRGNTFDSRWARYAIGTAFLGVTSLDAGDAHTAAVAPSSGRPPNEAFAWGRNPYGQLGVNDTAGRLSAARLTLL